MNFDFPFILTLLTILSGLIWLVDLIIWGKAPKGAKQPVVLEYAKSFFPVLLFVLLVRLVLLFVLLVMISVIICIIGQISLITCTTGND